MQICRFAREHIGKFAVTGMLGAEHPIWEQSGKFAVLLGAERPSQEQSGKCADLLGSKSANLLARSKSARGFCSTAALLIRVGYYERDTWLLLLSATLGALTNG